MPRTNAWLVVIVVASMLGVWYFGDVYQGPEEDQTTAVTSPEATPPVAEELLLPPPPSPADSRQAQLQQEIVRLQVELTLKTQESEARKKALVELQQRQAALVSSSGLSSQIQAREVTIQRLLDDLVNFRQAENDLNQSATSAMKNQDSQATLAQAEIDANIQLLEQEIFKTQNELHYWRNYPSGAEVLQQPAQIERLQLRLSLQTEQLNSLRAQRVGISATILNNNQVIQSLAEEVRADLRGSVLEMKEEIYSLRSEKDRLGRTQLQSREQLQYLRRQILSRQKEFDDSYQEVLRLQDSIKQKQSEILAR